MNIKKLRILRKICHHYKTNNLKCVFFGHKWLSKALRDKQTGELIDEDANCTRCGTHYKSYYYAK